MEIGRIISGKVIGVFKTHVTIECPDDFTGLLHVSNASDYYVSSLRNMFKIDKYYDFLVIDVDNQNKRLKLSWKDLVPRYLKTPFEFELKNTPQGFKTLKARLEKEVEND